MSLRSVRHLRRFVACLLALVLTVSVLSVVGGAPAGAANTASEGLHDHDNDADTARVRQFAGPNRYATSLAVAEGFVSTVSSGGFVDSIVVASGESLVDAATAAGLAGSKSAPVVLTPPNRLSSALEDFIVDEFISDVFIVGGTDAVSQEVEDEITALASVRNVVRLEGEDRYSTAVAVADEVGSPGDYCDSGEVGAVVVNVDSTFADVIAVGPMAHALELPILLTSTSGLSTDVTGYLIDTEIEHVIVVGGTTTVPEAIVTEITEAGVQTVTRIAGENRFSTAIEILRAMQSCTTLGVDPEEFALVNGDSVADGVSAAPLLARGLGDSGVTPVLLVSNTGVPSETSDYLASIPIRAATADYVDVTLTAIGGTAAVSSAVVAAALEAAITSEPLTATIRANAGATTATVTFSGAVSVIDNPEDEDGFRTSAVNRANYRIDGVPLFVSDTIGTASGRSVTITLGNGQKFAAGDTVTVLADRVKGLGGDGRRVEGVTHTVARKAPDTTRPRIRVFAPENAHEFRIQVIEENLQTAIFDDDGAIIPEAETALLENIERDGAPLRDASASPAVMTAQIRVAGSNNESIIVCLHGYTAASDCDDPNDAMDETNLATSERITVGSSAFADEAGNANRSVSARVQSNEAKPRAVRVTVSRARTYDENGAEPDGLHLASWQWRERVRTANADLDGDPSTPEEPVIADTNFLTITAKADSAVAGALGNDWFVDWYGLPDDPDDDLREAEVNVYESRRTVRIGFDNDATVFTVVSALLASDDVTELFDVTSDALTVDAVADMVIGELEDHTSSSACNEGFDLPEPGADLLAPSGGATRVTAIRGAPSSVRCSLRGGQSAVTLTLTYNDILQTFNTMALRDANTGDDGVAGDGFPADAGWPGWPDPPATLRLVSTIPLVLRSATLSELPTSGTTIDLPADVAMNYEEGGTSDVASNQRLRVG